MGDRMGATRDKKDASLPAVLKVASLADSPAPVSRRQVLGAAAAAGTVAAVGGRPGTAHARRERDREAEICVRSEIFACAKAPVALVADPSGCRLAVLDAARSLQVWDPNQPGAPLLEKALTAVDAVCMSENTLLRIGGGKLLARPLTALGSPDVVLASGVASPLLIHPSGAWAVCGIPTGGLQLIDLVEHQAQALSSLPPGAEEAQGLAADGPLGAWMWAGESLFRLRGLTGECELFQRFEGTAALHVTPDGRRLVVVRDAMVEVLRLPDLHLLQRVTNLSTGPFIACETWGRSAAFTASTVDSPLPDRLAILDLDEGAQTPELAPGLASPLLVAGLPLERGYALADPDGRVVVFASRPGVRTGLVPLADPALTVTHQRTGEQCTELVGYAGIACTCDSVEVKRGDESIGYQQWDAERAEWRLEQQPCGVPLPDGAVCTCDCVSLASGSLFAKACTCNTVCTCDTVCSCESVGSGTYTYTYTRTYWHPN
jgi:hypothetical protein